MEATQTASLSTEAKPKKVTKLKVDKVAKLQEQLDTLEAAFIKVATMSGQGNQIREFGFEMWKPQPKDMSQY